jgi:DNA-binding NarL/FixJ family response regulator
MLSAGASAYLLKDSTLDELRRAVEAVMSHKMYLSPAISSGLVEDYLRRLEEAKATQLSILSSKEREVLQLLAEGKTTKEIADILSVSPKTVETHRMHFMEKLNLHTVAELTKYAIRAGITQLEK